MGYFAKLGCAAQPVDETAAPAPREPEPTPAAVQPADVTTDEQPNTETASTVLALEPDTDTAARQAHEAAEAQRRAEWEAKQQARREAEQGELDRIAAMSDEEVTAASARRVGEDTEKLTRRNMKEAVCEHIQTLCRRNPAFARRAMRPGKSMINCFKYINRQAMAYAEQEMKDNGMERSGVYGLDVPDGLCFQWAEDYFNTDDVKEDHKNDEKFIPKPYIPASRKTSKVKADKKTEGAAKPEAPKARTGAKGVDGQLSFLEAV